MTKGLKPTATVGRMHSNNSVVTRGKSRVSDPVFLKNNTRDDFYGLRICQDPQSKALREKYEKENGSISSGQSLFSKLKTLPDIPRQQPTTSKKSDMLPLRPSDDNDLFPYRYSSAGPTVAGGTRLETLIQECARALKTTTRGKLGGRTTNDLNMVRQKSGWELTSLAESLKPFNKAVLQREKTGASAEEDRPERINHMQTMWTLRLPYKASSQFSQRFIDDLHPHWRNDPRYRRRVVYHSFTE